MPKEYTKAKPQRAYYKGDPDQEQFTIVEEGAEQSLVRFDEGYESAVTNSTIVKVKPQEN